MGGDDQHGDTSPIITVQDMDGPAGGQHPSPMPPVTTRHKKVDPHRATGKKNVLQISEDIASSAYGTSVNYQGMMKMLDSYLHARSPDEFEKIPSLDYDNLPFAIMKKTTRYLPVDIPIGFEFGTFKFHPDGYPALKKGVLDVYAGINSFAKAIKGDEFRYFRDKMTDSGGKSLRIKDNGILNPIAVQFVEKKLKQINDAYLQVQVDKMDGKTFRKLVDELVDVEKFNRDVDEFWKSIEPDITSGKVDMNLVRFKNSYEFEASVEKNGIRWTIKFAITEEGGKVTLGKALNFMAEADSKSLMEAAKKMKDIECTGFSFRPAFKKSGFESFFFNRRLILSPDGKPYVPLVNPSRACVHFKTYRSALFQGFLEGMKAYSGGSSLEDAVKIGLSKAGFSAVTAVGGAVLMHKIATWGLKKFLATSVKGMIFRRALIVIPIVGWIVTAWDTAKTVYEIIDNYEMSDVKEIREYADGISQEYKVVNGAFSSLKESKQYMELVDPDPPASRRAPPGSLRGREEVYMRPYRWTYTGPGPESLGRRRGRTGVVSWYDVTPRGIKTVHPDGSTLEFGEEVFTNVDTFPFCRFLPDLNQESDYHKLKAKFYTIEDQISDLQGLVRSEHWRSDTEKIQIRDAKDSIEMTKAEICVLDNKLETKWAFIQTPDKDAAYWWRDHKGNCYVWELVDGQPVSEPQESEKSMEMISKIKDHLGIRD